MSAAILTLFLSMGASPEGLYVYRGTVIADKGEAALTKKTFELTVMVHGQSPKLYWTVSESGRGAWPWTARFGKASLDPQWQMNGAHLPTVLYKHEGGDSPVKLLSPLYKAPKKLVAGASWKSGKMEYKVVDSRKVGGRKVWRIHVGNAYGRKRTLLIDQKEPLVVGMRERVFIGQGQQHELQMQLVKSSKLKSPKEVAATVEAFSKLDQLRTKAKLQVRKPRLSLNKGQLTLLRKDLPAVAAISKKSFLAPVVLAATRETRVQRGRSGAIAELRRQAMGKTFSQLTFTSLRNKRVSIKTQGKVTVLHFWAYRDKPLQEPYGQVGYLDFLNRQSKKKSKLQVFGIAVNQQLANPAQRRTAIRSARKLKSFMNLGYDVLADAESQTLKSLGDPRVAGVRLPLFVVLDGKGKVIHYKVGFYKVRRDRGLELLQQVVTAALKKDR